MHYVGLADVLEFVGVGARCEELAATGHDLPRPLSADAGAAALRARSSPSARPAADLIARLPALVEQYRAEYTAYYERCRHARLPADARSVSGDRAHPGPRPARVPEGQGSTARVAAEFYESTIRIVRWAEAVDEYVPITEQEAFDIEYWSLEEAKLQRLPQPKSLEGRDRAWSRAAAGASARQPRRGCWPKGAAVVLADIDDAALDRARAAS